MTYLKLAVIAVYFLSRKNTKPYTLNEFYVLIDRFPILTIEALLAATVLNFTKENDQ